MIKQTKPFNRITNLLDLPLKSTEEISKSEVLAWTHKRNIELGDRTLDFWVRQGLLKKAKRGSDKFAYWPKSYILEEVTAIDILTKKFSQILSALGKLAKQTGYKLNVVASDLIEIEKNARLIIDKNCPDEKKKRIEIHRYIQKVIDIYVDKILEGKLNTNEKLKKFQELADDYIKAAAEALDESDVDYSKPLSKPLEHQAVKMVASQFKRGKALKDLEAW